VIKLPDKLPSSYALRLYTKKQQDNDYVEKLITDKKKEQKKRGEHIEHITK
jgi:hypothetical protein